MNQIINIDCFVLDDDPIWLKLIGKTFEQTATFKYNLYHNEHDFLEAVKSGINICVIDNFLGFSTGLEILRKTMNTNPLNYCIMMSSLITLEMVLQFQDEGAKFSIDKSSKNFLQRLTGIVEKAIESTHERIEFFMALENVQNSFEKLTEILEPRG